MVLLCRCCLVRQYFNVHAFDTDRPAVKCKLQPRLCIQWPHKTCLVSYKFKHNHCINNADISGESRKKHIISRHTLTFCVRRVMNGSFPFQISPDKCILKFSFPNGKPRRCFLRGLHLILSLSTFIYLIKLYFKTPFQIINLQDYQDSWNLSVCEKQDLFRYE